MLQNNILNRQKLQCKRFLTIRNGNKIWPVVRLTNYKVAGNQCSVNEVTHECNELIGTKLQKGK